MRTLTAMFDSRAEAENARDRLTSAGLGEHNVAIYDKSSLEGGHGHSGAGQSGSRDDDRGVSHGQPDEGRADGSEGVHRNLLGDFIDNRTGEKIGADLGSERNLLGDFIDDNHERRGDHGTSHGRDGDSSQGDRRDDRSTGLWASIKHMFGGDGHVYEDAMRRGGFLLTARVADDAVETAMRIFGNGANVDLDERQGHSRGDASTLDNRSHRGRIGTY